MSVPVDVRALEAQRHATAREILVMVEEERAFWPNGEGRIACNRLIGLIRHTYDITPAREGGAA
jgi:hypothetical protein